MFLFSGWVDLFNAQNTANKLVQYSDRFLKTRGNDTDISMKKSLKYNKKAKVRVILFANLEDLSVWYTICFTVTFATAAAAFFFQTGYEWLE